MNDDYPTPEQIEEMISSGHTTAQTIDR